MVKSGFISTKIYDEITRVELDDLDEEVNVYVFEDNEYLLGKENMDVENDIVYFHIYSIADEMPFERVGVFEMKKEDFNTYLEESDMSKGNVLFFDKIKVKTDEYEMNDNDYIELSDDDIFKIDVSEISEGVEEEKKGDEEKDDIFENVEVTTKQLLQEETERDVDNEKSKYKASENNTWIEEFTKNNNFSIIDNEGGGDCVFAVFRDAFRDIGKKTSVDKLRKVLQNEVKEEYFENYRNMYLSADSEYKSVQMRLKENEKMLTKLKKDMEVAPYDVGKELYNEIRELEKERKLLKKERLNATNLKKEFDYMEGINNYEEFRDLLLSNRFWGDAWAISTLEKKLNVKMIILSEESYLNDDHDGIMQCGQLNDNEKEEMKTFKPDYYIMACYTGRHYKLLGYKEKKIFRFQEVPYSMKTLIINKCLEKNSGPYYLISDFRNLKRKVGLNVDVGEMEDDVLDTKDLYSTKTTFMFHSKSNPNPAAGKGSGEMLESGRDVGDKGFAYLNSVKNWRRMLDDSYEAPFTMKDNLRFHTMKHYYMGSQFKNGYPEIYKNFSLSGDNEINQSVQKAKSYYEKNEKKIDPNFFEIGIEPRYEQERMKGLEAKFTQNLDLKRVLLETKDAKLVEFKRRDVPSVDTALMQLRKQLNAEIA